MERTTVTRVIGTTVAGGVLALAGYNLAEATTVDSAVPAQQSPGSTSGYDMPNGAALAGRRRN